MTMGFASGEPHTAITASPMLRVSKRLTANVFRGQMLRQGPAQLMPPTPKLPAYYVGCQVEGTASEPYFQVSIPGRFAGPPWRRENGARDSSGTP